MIKIGRYDVQRFFKYEVIEEPVYDSSNGFTTADGTTHKCFICNKKKISLSSKMIDTATAALIETAMSGEMLSVEYALPNGTTATGTFRCDSRPFELIHRFSDTQKYWQFNITLEEV